MCHKGMARGSTAAVTLPVVTAIAGKVRPVAVLMEIRPFTSDPLLSPRRSDGQESTSSSRRRRSCGSKSKNVRTLSHGHKFISRDPTGDGACAALVPRPALAPGGASWSHQSCGPPAQL